MNLELLEKRQNDLLELSAAISCGEFAAYEIELRLQGKRKERDEIIVEITSAVCDAKDGEGKPIYGNETKRRARIKTLLDCEIGFVSLEDEIAESERALRTKEFSTAALRREFSVRKTALELLAIIGK